MIREQNVKDLQLSLNLGKTLIPFSCLLPIIEVCGTKICMTEGSDDMKNKNPKQKHAKNSESTIHFKGTFIAVMLLGVFLVASWFGIYALFLSR